MSVFANDPGDKKQHELTYMHDVDMAMHRRNHPWAWILSFSVVLFFAAGFFWADMAMIDDVTRGMGQVIPAQGIRPIQSEKGGTITEILVKDNEQVEVNQPLLTISNVQAVAGLRELQHRFTELSFSLKRLIAEEQENELVYSEDEKLAAPEVVAAQMRLYQTRKEQYEGQAVLLQSQLESRRHEVAEAESRKANLAESLAITQQKARTIKPMVDSGAYSRIEYLNLLGEITTQQGELDSIIQTVARAQSGVTAAQERLNNLRAERRASIADEINKTRLEQSTIEQQLRASDEQVTRTEMKSPVRGTVKQVLLKKDSVAKPAETIMEIIPTDGALEIQARFTPADRGFLFVNQEAMVKVTTYDFSIYGGLEATVIKISDDAIEDRRGDLWYEVRFLTKRRSLFYQGRELAILPGMTVSVDVLTDKKSVLSHIIGPIRRALQSAMTEH
ncbi:HlyD family secretion protein [Desulfovibrio sp. OttesenSCG-928-A18]|nr:HlyD family secretion protein [Desulfovibrio sp. OttesenSCG-928-A18]